MLDHKAEKWEQQQHYVHEDRTLSDNDVPTFIPLSYAPEHGNDPEDIAVDTTVQPPLTTPPAVSSDVVDRDHTNLCDTPLAPSPNFSAE